MTGVAPDVERRGLHRDARWFSEARRHGWLAYFRHIRPRRLGDRWRRPNRDLRKREDRQMADIDALRAFAEVCREDVRV